MPERKNTDVIGNSSGPITCANCGADLSRGKRARDNNTGSYYCPAFALAGVCESASTEPVSEGTGATGPRRALAGGMLGQAQVLSDQAPAEDGLNEDDGIIALDPETDGPEPTGARSVVPSAPRVSACPVCLAGLTSEQRCFGCGFDSAKGLRSSTMVLKTKDEHGTRTVLCPGCGYDMGAGVSMICPECGKGVPIENKISQYARQSKDTVRKAYLQPALMLAIGGLIMLGVWFNNLGLVGLGAYPIYLTGITLAGTVVFQIMCLTFIGFDAPLHLTALRLAGVYAVMGVVNLVADFIPIPLLPFLITLLVYVGLLMQMLELEVSDAIILAIGVGLVQVLLGAVLVMVLIAAI